MPLNEYFIEEPLDAQLLDLVVDQLLASDRIIIEEGGNEFNNGVGPFGLSPANPILVNGITGGETFYLNCLRSRSGARFLYHRLGSCVHPVSFQPIDIFELLATDGSLRLCLFLAMYRSRRSRLVPEGLSSAPWNGLSDFEKKLYKASHFGQHIYVDNFPFGLPDMIEGSQELKDIEPDLDIKMANVVREILINLKKQGC